MPANVHSLDHIILQRGVQPIGNQRCLQNGKDQFSGPVEQIFKWRSGGGGELMQMCKHEQTRGVWGYALPRKFQI